VKTPYHVLPPPVIANTWTRNWKTPDLPSYYMCSWCAGKKLMLVSNLCTRSIFYY